jgi:hypothetical protein
MEEIKTVHENLGVMPAVILTIFFCALNVILLSDELHRNAI